MELLKANSFTATFINVCLTYKTFMRFSNWSGVDMILQDFDLAVDTCTQTLESVCDDHVFGTAFCHITHRDVQIFAFPFRSGESRCNTARGTLGARMGV
jgi:hypothetical protein